MAALKNVLCTFLIVFICSEASPRSPMPEILMDQEIDSNSVYSVENNQIDPLVAALRGDIKSTTDIPCHIELQVTKKVVGHCMNLGNSRSTPVCMAGSTLYPFHHECVGRSN